MKAQELSPREKEIVELCSEGLTDQAIANRLGLSIGTVNTYWLRIKMKKGGSGRTEAVVNIFKERAALALKEERVDWEGLATILAKREALDVISEKQRGLELRTRLAMLQLAMGHIQSAVWATDEGLSIHFTMNEELPLSRFGVKWEDGKTIYEIFKTTDKAHPAVVAHVGALAGVASETRLSGDNSDMFLRVLPVKDELGEIICCVSILEHRN